MNKKEKCKFDESMDCELPEWRGGCTEFKFNDCKRLAEYKGFRVGDKQ